MLGVILFRLHAAMLALRGCESLLRGGADPFATVHGVLDALERNAIARRENQAIHHIREARRTVTREALKPLPPTVCPPFAARGVDGRPVPQTHPSPRETDETHYRHPPRHP